MADYSTSSVLDLKDDVLIGMVDQDVRHEFSDFMKEFNRREWSVRIAQDVKSFEEYVQKKYEHRDQFGYGFVVDDSAVPYFHPNRSFHDEVIWLNENLYYDSSVSYENRLLNSAIVKFYGPSRTLEIITGVAKRAIPYLKDTGIPYVDFVKFRVDEDYAYDVMANIEMAFANKEQIWGTTELRTSLQVAARNCARETGTHIDHRGVKNPKGGWIVEPKSPYSDRKMRASDMIWWIAKLSDRFISFYRTQPTMEKSFEFLTENRGIGNYYGYHFSSNLARMPGIGSSELIMAEHSEKFNKLMQADPVLTHGNLDENANYVMAGPSAMETLGRLWPQMPINSKTAMKMIIAIRDVQEDFLNIDTEDAIRHLKEASELGRFTTFGVEISCCQFAVFSGLKDSKTKAIQRARAPISKEVGNKPTGLEMLFK